MLALDLLGVPFARGVYVRVQIPRVRAPMIRIKAGEPEGLQQRFELQKDFIFAAPKDIGQNRARLMMLGKDKARCLGPVPHPPRLAPDVR